jgi:TolB-like protein/Tfp pilus assembly protein PilF
MPLAMRRRQLRCITLTHLLHEIRQALLKSSKKITAWVGILVLLVTLIYLYRDELAINPEPINKPQDRTDRAYPNHIYYGPPNSIAVLPFEFTQAGAEPASDSFISRGLAESLINQLVQIPELQVTSPSSSLFFKAGAVDLPIMAERLKVTQLLVGSIRQTGNALHITARLINVKSDKELWSETFATTLLELPDDRDRLSRAVISAMNPASNGNPAGAAVDPQTWLLLLEARYLLHLRGTQNLERAESLFKRALEIEPDSAQAYLGLAQTYLDPAWSSDDSSPGHERAREAALTALEFAPELAEAQLVLSRIRRTFDWDWQGAREAAQAALTLRPGSAAVLSNASNNEFTFGYFEQAIELLQEAIRRDPMVLPLLLRLGLLYEFAGDYEQSLIAYRQLLGLNPDYPAAHAYRARVKLAQGKAESALTEAELEHDPFWQRHARILALIALERFDEADLLLDQMITQHAGDAAFQLAEIHAFRGDVDGAFTWLELGWRQRDGGMSEMIGNHFLAILQDDPRWGDLLNRMGLP